MSEEYNKEVCDLKHSQIAALFEEIKSSVTYTNRLLISCLIGIAAFFAVYAFDQITSQAAAALGGG